MKRFASFLTAALAGSLVSAAPVAGADSMMYLVPISDLNATYAPGATVQFAAVLDLGVSAFGSFSVPTTVAYATTQFGSAKPTFKYDATEDPIEPGTGNPLWNLTTPTVFATTASTINGAKVLTIQASVGHAATPTADHLSTLAVPAGTYTIATFTFPISAVSGLTAATVYLPTAFGYSNSANTADGAYQIGVGPLQAIRCKDVLGNALLEPLTFPNTGGKHSSLTFKVSVVLPTAPLAGTLQFTELASNAAAQRVTFQFRAPASGSVFFTQTASVPVTGAFTLLAVPLQNYALWIKPDKFLARKINVTASGGAFSPVAQAFDGGDGNNDNMVDTSDFGLLVGAYSGDSNIPGSGYDPRADFNGDGLVDPTDFSILVDNYGEKGDL